MRQSNRAGLRPFVAVRLDEFDLGADAEVVEVAVEHGVPVEVDLTTVGRFEKAVALFREHTGDEGKGRGRVGGEGGMGGGEKRRGLTRLRRRMSTLDLSNAAGPARLARATQYAT